MATLLLHNKLYLFRGTNYWSYDLRAGEKDKGYPKNISRNWLGIFQSVDAAVNWDNTIVYFFQGPLFIKFNAERNSVEGAPLQTASHWPGVWAFGIEAVIKVNKETCYFFRRNQYIKYNIFKKEAEYGYPKPITHDWKMPFTTVNGAVVLNNKKILFFNNDNVVQYDIIMNCADTGYPISIDDYVKRLVIK